MDLCVITGPDHDRMWATEDKTERIDAIMKIRNALRKGGVQPVFAITKCRIPIVKFEGNNFLSGRSPRLCPHSTATWTFASSQARTMTGCGRRRTRLSGLMRS
mmetsp:Transcript_105949/g.182715  ORF Transcript_105949/g.182715 Transcript_105949/m.182715 type:complete len:103 (-) Transcript_105949:99-407(-)